MTRYVEHGALGRGALQLPLPVWGGRAPNRSNVILFLDVMIQGLPIINRNKREVDNIQNSYEQNQRLARSAAGGGSLLLLLAGASSRGSSSSATSPRMHAALSIVVSSTFSTCILLSLQVLCVSICSSRIIPIYCLGSQTFKVEAGCFMTKPPKK